MLNQFLNRESASLSATRTGLQLNEWSPIQSLPKRYQDEILNRSTVKEFSAGEIIFMIKADDEEDFYLLEGTVELINESRQTVETIAHSGEKTLQLIDHSRPRAVTAKAKQDCKVFVTRRTFFDTLNSANAGKQAIPEVEVNEIDMEGSGNWMLSMLNSSVFSSLPPANLQQIFIHMDTLKVASGTTVVQQGVVGEQFYLIQHGDAVIEKQSANGETKTLANLSSGETFGERSLIMGSDSDVAVTMESDGVLMLLPKENFSELVYEPLIHSVSIEEADLLVTDGATWLDIRDSFDYQTSAIKGSTNIELENLYTAIKGLNLNQKYIVCGNSQEHAQASAFFLTISGFNVCALSSSVAEYLGVNSEAGINIQAIAKEEVPDPVLETTVDEDMGLSLEQAESLDETVDEPPQIRVNTDAIAENMQNISKDLEQQIRNDINKLFIQKQKELEAEIEQRFKQYHQVTAKLMKKKLDDLSLVHQVQAKLAKKKS